ncbi:hypothetical protein Y1Q_0013147 [Alligator mississippiensis]|uniref:Peptidase S1 domain-containing protein n=1 Tax=Alligator mississippiensis TaxID=8496 RepID=A0A151NH14_ALLMI|nr:hypothetical protein Y1Q_0013147 [Alligator mississippiensis]
MWENRQVIAMRCMIPHEDYNNETLENDIMLLKLAHRAAINSNVKLIALPQPNYVVKPGTTCSMAGWGMTGLGKKTNVLQEVDLKMGDQKQREEKDDLFNSATMIFTGDEKDHKPPFECENISLQCA